MVAAAPAAPTVHARLPGSTREAIIKAAQSVLIESGVRGFSMRAVAAACGITHGNAQYYFPTVESLLDGLIRSSMESYTLEFEKQLSGMPMNSADECVNLMGWVIDDSFSRETGRLFRCFYQLDSQYPGVSATMSTFYEVLTTRLARWIHAALPATPFSEIKDLTWMMALLAEGAVLLGTEQRRSDTKYKNRLKRIACDQVRAKLSSLLREAERSGGLRKDSEWNRER